MDTPLRGLRTSMTEPSAAVRTMLPLRFCVSVLPGGPGCPGKLRDGTGGPEAAGRWLALRLACIRRFVPALVLGTLADGRRLVAALALVVLVCGALPAAPVPEGLKSFCS